jgi:hypothetical protein
MTLPASGAISMSQVRTELGASGAISLGQASVRTLAGVASGAISLGNLYGKANAFAATITSNQTNLNLRTWAIANGWNGTTAATITINSGVYIYSTSTGTAGMTIDGSWPSGVTVINNGFILGCGGTGGMNAAGSAGGNAISLGTSVTITNNSYIAGGGGGGGSGAAVLGGTSSYAGGGGGAGGGAGGTTRYAGTTQIGPGGAGGNAGASGSNGIANTVAPANMGAGGGGGGGILPGTGGAAGRSTTGSTNSVVGGGGGGSGGGGGFTFQATSLCAPGAPRFISLGGGGGGGWGAPGGIGGVVAQICAALSTTANGVGGSAGATGGDALSTGVGPGGAGGKCVALNGLTVTWNATGTRYGAIS